MARIAGLACVVMAAGWGLVACTEDPPPNLLTQPDAGDEDAGVTSPDAGEPDAGSNPEDAGQVVADSGTIIDLCNPLAQTGCMNMDKCIVESGSMGPGAHCVTSSVSDKPRGDTCSGGDCEAGLVCVRPASTATVASCQTLCDPMTRMGCENLPGEWECRSRIRESNWNACVELPPVCNPYTQAPCDALQACQPFQRLDMSFEYRCRTAGTADDGQACGGTTGMGCKRGLVCVRDPATGESSCGILCQLNTDCPNMRQCSRSISQPASMYCAP